MTGHALALVVAVGKRCVYRRQSWKVAMLTGEEVYFSFHNFLQLYFGNDEELIGSGQMFIRAHNLKVFVLPLNVAFKGI